MFMKLGMHEGSSTKTTNQTVTTNNHQKTPTYCTPNPVPNVPENNQVRLIEYRGEKLATFTVESKELICLPQAFEMFLKHLVGGLHTVYTKLKRLEIVPVVCNVEQVRILRGLGAIQPGVNRCKLIAPYEFDVLYADCTNSSARPGRPSKRIPSSSSGSLSSNGLALEKAFLAKLTNITGASQQFMNQPHHSTSSFDRGLLTNESHSFTPEKLEMFMSLLLATLQSSTLSNHGPGTDVTGRRPSIPHDDDDEGSFERLMKRSFDMISNCLVNRSNNNSTNNSGQHNMVKMNSKLKSIPTTTTNNKDDTKSKLFNIAYLADETEGDDSSPSENNDMDFCHEGKFSRLTEPPTDSDDQYQEVDQTSSSTTKPKALDDDEFLPSFCFTNILDTTASCDDELPCSKPRNDKDVVT